MSLVCYYIFGGIACALGIAFIVVPLILGDDGELIVIAAGLLLLGIFLLYTAFNAVECPNCEVVVDTSYCETCGWDARSALGVCTNCGSGNGDVFCAECGARKGESE